MEYRLPEARGRDTDRKLLFNEHRVCVGEDKKVLGIDSGDEYTHCINATALYTYNS